MPVGPELASRFASVLEVVYLIFNEGYAATSGESWYRAELCDEAMRLGRMLSALAPEEPEAHGLVALMEIQASRIPARTGPGGAPVTLLEQDRGRWNRLLITHGLAALAKAAACAKSTAPARTSSRPSSPPATPGRAPPPTPTGPASSRSTIPSARSPRPRSSSSTAPSPSPWPTGPARALAIVESLDDDPALRGYHLLPAVRADLLARLGRADQAREEFERAAALAANDSERAHLLRRAAGGRNRGADQTPSYRFQLYGVVVDTLTRPDRSRIGRENSVESLLMYFFPIRSADRARSAVSAR